MSDMAKVKRRLDVLWGDVLIGTYDLLEDDSELFTYDAEYLASKGASPISHSLPLRSAPYGRIFFTLGCCLLREIRWQNH